MSNTFVEIRKLGDFQTNHQWQFYVSDVLNVWSTDTAKDLDIRCQTIDTEVTKEKTTHVLTFVETVDGRAYNLLRSIIQTDAIIKIKLLDRQDVATVVDIVNLYKSKCKIVRHLDSGAESDILKIRLEIETDT